VVRTCYRLRMTRLRKEPIELTCAECGATFMEQRKARIDAARRSGRAYCRDSCRDAWVLRSRSRTMADTNRRHASARMRANNPMHREDSREAMKATLERIGHRPRERGGNGSKLPDPQKRLSDFLGWPTEVIVAPSDGGRPYHYKLDIAHPTMMVCVEVDGASHYSRARHASDTRRDARLASLGWLTFRFSNRDAMERTAECAATVLSTTSKWKARTPT